MSPELMIVIHYLREAARAYQKHANALLADTSQNAPEAREEEAAAKALRRIVEDLEIGRHLK